MKPIRTNRDLYVLVTETPLRDPTRSLEVWICALIHLIEPVESPTPDQAGRWFIEAFSTEPVPLQPDWSGLVPDTSPSHAGCINLLKRQAADLAGMRTSGALERTDRYFGLRAVSGQRWFNFTPTGYLERGVEGAMGDGGDLVALVPPGQDEDDEQMRFGWELLIDILLLGQQYE